MQTASPTLGCNYKALQANWSADMVYFNAIGLKGIRPNLASIPSGWSPPGAMSAGSYEYWRLCASTFAAAGFWVSWGPSGLSGADTAGSFTATNWTQYHAAVIADATYMQSQGIALGVYELGNEMEALMDGTTITIPQFIVNMAQLATDVKAVYSLSPIGYSCYDYNSTTYNQWITNGLGGLDYLGVHPYSNINAGGRGLSLGGYQNIQYPNDSKVLYKFGSNHCYVSEFGLEATDAYLQSMPKYLQVAMMRDRWAYLKNMGFTQSMVYTYVGYLNADNQFAMLDMNGQYELMWDPLVQNGKRTGNVNFN